VTKPEREGRGSGRLPARSAADQRPRQACLPLPKHAGSPQDVNTAARALPSQRRVPQQKGPRHRQRQRRSAERNLGQNGLNTKNASGKITSYLRTVRFRGTAAHTTQFLPR